MLLEINTANFLYKLSRRYNKEKLFLGDVPDEVWEEFSGVKYIWLMGVWKRSKTSRKIAIQNVRQYIPYLPSIKEEDILGSPYSIVDYDPEFGTFQDLLKVKKNSIN